MQSIPIALSSDNKCFFALATTLASALENKREETDYNIYVFCAEDVTQENKEKVSALVSMYHKATITFIDMAGQFSHVHMDHAYLTVPTYYRMVFASMLPQYEKILYLDIDILVRKDLTEFYNIDIKDNYLAGVPVFLSYFKLYEKTRKITGLSNLEFFINAGVLLMNLKAIQRDKIEEQWQSLIGMGGDADQPILNAVCYKKIAIIPCKYNVSQVDLPFYMDGKASTFYDTAELKNAFEDPVIFHYTGKEKPWNYKDLFLAREWYRYYLLTPFADIELKRQYYANAIKPKLKWYHKVFYKEKTSDGMRHIYFLRIRVFSYTHIPQY